MGDHHQNGRSIAKANRPPVKLGDEHYQATLETAIELNAEHMALINETVEEARRVGEDERRAVAHLSAEWNPKETPEKFDVVVYDRMQVMRPNPFLPDPRMIPTALIRLKEHSRTPLVELQKRADQAFDEAKGPEQQPQ